LSRADYFIDAQTGQVLGKKDKLHHSDATGAANTQYSGIQTIHSDLKGTKYRLWDLSRGNGILTLHGDKLTNLDYTSPTANWNLTGQNQHAMDVHWGVEETYDFYKTKFNRNSLG
jgi:Zn-dependent metalloprotease